MELRPSLLVLLLVSGTTCAQNVTQTQVGTSSTASTAAAPVRLTPEEQLAARIWGLTTDEMLRASTLLKGPRASFSVPNLSPIEALGIHARTEVERRKYAEMFARAQHEDIQRVIAFANEYAAAMKRLYGDEPVVDFSGTEPLAASPAQALAARLPKGAFVPVIAPARPLAKRRAQP